MGRGVDSTRRLERVSIAGGVAAALVLAFVAVRLGDDGRTIGRGAVAERAATLAGAVEARWRLLASDPAAWFPTDGARQRRAEGLRRAPAGAEEPGSKRTDPERTGPERTGREEAAPGGTASEEVGARDLDRQPAAPGRSPGVSGGFGSPAGAADGPSMFVWTAALASAAPPEARAPAAGRSDAALVASLLLQADLGRDPRAVERAIAAARGLVDDPVLGAEIELRAIRRAREDGRLDDLRTAFERLWERTPRDAVAGGLPARAAGLLAAASGLPDVRVWAAAGELLADAAAGRLVLPTPTVTVSPSSGSPAPAPRVAVLLDRLGELAGPGGAEQVAQVRRFLLDRAAYERLAPLLPPGPGFRLAREGGDVVALERTDEGGRAARWSEAGTLGLLRARVRADDLLASAGGEALELAPAAAVPASARVGPPLVLSDIELTVALTHPDLSGWIAAAGGRVRATQLALGLLGLLALAAGATTAAVLRRRRRLDELRVQWIASVSHELRTPVAALSLAAERLERTRTARPERLAAYHDAILLETRRLGRLVAQVMDLSRIERGLPPAIERTTIDPGATLAELCRSFEPMLAAAGIDLLRERSELPAEFELDRDAMARILENLLRNAAEHSLASRVRVAWSFEPSDAAGDSGDVVLEVRDDGRGLEPEAALFEPFRRGRDAERARGVGLGLGIARELARAHGGDLLFLTPVPGWPGAGWRVTLEGYVDRGGFCATELMERRRRAEVRRLEERRRVERLERLRAERRAREAGSGTNEERGDEGASGSPERSDAAGRHHTAPDRGAVDPPGEGRPPRGGPSAGAGPSDRAGRPGAAPGRRARGPSDRDRPPGGGGGAAEPPGRAEPAADEGSSPGDRDDRDPDTSPDPERS